MPHVENLLRLIPIESPSDLKLLLTIVWHARVEYLAYWIYNDLKLSNTNENFSQEVLQMIADYSADLRKYLDGTGKSDDVVGLATIFQQTCGSVVIPTSQYARYLQALNE
jgi:hypothetical protein